jgi:hypothetical protein
VNGFFVYRVVRKIVFTMESLNLRSH